MKVGICVSMGILVATLQATGSLSLESVSETITSVEQVDLLVRTTQEQFWQLFPPMDNIIVLTEQNVRPVRWSSGWPDGLKKQMYAEMRSVNNSLYPVYILWAKADKITGDLTYFNRYGAPVWTSPAPEGYSPFGFLMERIGAKSIRELTEIQRKWSASNLGLEIQLIPEAFIESYEKDVAVEAYAAVMQESIMSPMSMMISMESEPELQMGIANLSNGTVEVFVEWLSSLNSDSLDLFLCNDLIAADWQLQTNFPTASSTNFYFTDLNTNQVARFYVTGTMYDEDLDGLASARERYLYKTREDLFDTEGDGLGDGWEITYGFDPFSTIGSNGALGDSDNDGYSNLEEQLLETDPLISDSGGTTGSVATIRYYYDEDDRLTDFYSGSEVAQKTILTASHNISEEVSAK